MSIQTRSFVNGAWITQTVDVHHLVAQNRERCQQERPATPLEPPQKPPLMGVLSQTLIRSPVAKFIIPARIRHESKNDVVYIYENYFEIQEVKTDVKIASMERVAVKADLDSSIRSARVFGLRRKYILPSPEGANDGGKKKTEEEDGRGSLRPDLPPHILVLALESKMLAFIFAFHDGAGPIRFLQCRRPLPVGRSQLEQLGEFLAIDPKAMAVAAHQGSFCLYALKSMDEIRGAVQGDGLMDGSRFQPVKEERHIQVEGQILKMEFLYPPEEQGYKNRVILLLIISKDRTSRIICYEWDSATRLATASPVGDGQRLRSDEQLPLLLVPLTNCTAFMLVCEKRITVYKDILAGNAIAHTIPIRTHDPAEESGISQKLPIWTQWARPSRHDLHMQNQDNIYLCREDGVVHFLEIKDGVQMVHSTHHVGELGVNVDISFASIDLGCKGSDLLLVSGDDCDGGGWLFEARQNAKRLFSNPKWTSMADFVTTDDPDVLEAFPRQAATGPDKNKLPNRLFAATGRDREHGGITEIRFGTEGRKHTDLCGDLPQIGVNRVWVLNGFTKGGGFILLSYPTQTLLRQIDETKDDVVENDYTNIDFDAGTVAAGATKDGLIIQVTRNSLRASFYGPDVEPFQQQTNVMAACVRVREDDSIALLLLAYLSDNVHFLNLSKFELNGGAITYHRIGVPLQLPDQPTFVSIERVGLDYFAFVGTVSAALLVYRIQLRSGLSPVLDYQFKGTVAVCDSVAVLGSQSARARRHLILCGLRNGSLEVLRWDQESSSLVLHEKLQIGNTSIAVMADYRKPTRAILLCDQKLHTLEQPSEHSIDVQAPLLVNNIYLTDSENISFEQGMIDAMTQDVKSTSQGLVFCVEGKRVSQVSLSLDAETSVIPRRIAIGGTPKRVKYSPTLNKLFVLYHFTQTTYLAAGPGRHNRTDQRHVQYSIALVDPNAQALVSNPGETRHENSVLFDHFKPGEIALGLTEWFPQDNNGGYHILVVNTLQQHPAPLQPSGRIYLFKVLKTEILRLQKTIEKAAPVYALTPYGSNSLLYSCGTDLCLQALSTKPDSSGWKFQDCGIKIALLSQVRHISVREPLVYLSTSGNSLFILKVEGNKLVPQFNDEVGRHNLFHLTIPQWSLVLTSQTGGMITGLWQPSNEKGTTVVSTVFEALLPSSVTRLRRINPPPWKQYLDSESSVAAVGSTTDGSFFQFSILDENAWRLLAFIQTLALRSPDICPFVNTIEAHRRPLEPSTNPLDMHINGDILRRILERGGERCLIDMMSYDPILKIVLAHYQPHDIAPADQNSLDHWMRLATEIARLETQARQSMMWKYAQGVGLDATDGKDLAAKVVHWMMYRVQKLV